MKVAVHLPNASPTQGGGFTFQDSLHTAITQHNAARNGSDAADHEFVIFTEAPSDKPAAEPSQAKVIHVPSSTKDRIIRRGQLLANHLQDMLLRRRYVQFDTQFERLVRASGCDVAWFATTAYCECSIPYLYTIWDLQHLDQPWFPEVGNPRDFFAREQLTRAAIARATCIVTPNAQGAEELVRGYAVHSSRILMAPHPTPDFALAAARAPHQTLPDELGLQPGFLLYPAQFWAHKNHVTLLRALKRLHELGEKRTLVLVGSNKGNRTHVERTVNALGLNQYVRMLGFVEQSTLSALYQNAACLTYPSMFGPENLPPLEAFAMGCPVVAAHYRGAAEQLGDSALLVEPSDDAAFASAIHRVLVSPDLREQLIESGRKRASQFTSADYLALVVRFLDAFARVRANWA